ncbi:MAG: PAS domain S-box protein [Candidatus Acidiferrum sp.]|jgi:PAS domain S-box-containing protein
MKQTDTRNIEDFSEPENETREIGSRRIERREWWLWSTAIAITLLLTSGIASFLPVLLHSHDDWVADLTMRQAVWGLLGMVLLFDLYTIYQQLQIHRIRRQLEAREKLFRLITENAADMIAVVDTEGKRIYNSLSYQKVLGYSPAELQRSSAFEQIHPDDRERVAAAGAEARRTGEGKTLEYRIRHKDGTWRVLESTSSVIRSGKGEPAMLVIVNRDVTGRKQAEDALRAEHDLLRALIDNMPDLIYVKDAGSGFVLANRALAQLMGAKNPEDLLGKTDFDYFPKELATAYYSDEQAILQTGLPLLNQEERSVDAEGNAKWLSTSKVPLRDRQGEVLGIIGIGRDITVGRQAEQALRQSETSFRSVVEGAPYGIFRASVDGRFLRVNSALQEMLGYRSSTDLLDANLGDHVFRNRADFHHLVELLGSVDEFKDVEMEWKRKDDSPITVLCSGRRAEGGDENSTYNEVFVEDITERRVLERQLRMAAKMEAVGRLSGGIAHDFNNLLGVIIGYSQMLARKMERDNPLHEYIEEIEKAGQRATSLTRQLLAFSRQQILTPKVLNLNELVSDMVKMLPRLIGEDIAISTKLEPAIGNVKADQGQIEQVVMNLAVNARDAMPSGGRLTIGTADVVMDEMYARQHPGAKPGKYVILSVADSGVGMNSETLLHIFEPFFTTKEVGKGTGLGLATVYGIMKQSGGYIWVDSELGKGSCFQIFLPRVEETVTHVAEQTSPSPNSQGSETILVAEDAEPLRKLARTFLEERGFQVLTASSGEEALKVAAEFSGKIHLLLTDVVMPGMNGRVLAEQLLPKRPGMKVLYMSGYTDSFIAGHGVLEEGTHLLHKPFTEEVLISKVCEVLKSVRAIAGMKAPLVAELPRQKV